MRRSEDAGEGVLSSVVAVFLAVAVGLLVFHTVDSYTATDQQVAGWARAVTDAETVLQADVVDGCGVVTGTESASQMGTFASVCPGGDTGSFAVADPGGYTVMFESAWTDASAPVPSACGDYAGLSPTDLTVNAVVHWTVRTVNRSAGGPPLAETRTVTSAEPIPADALAYNLADPGAVVVDTAPGAAAELVAANDPSVTVTHYAGSNGCVWFPFLTPGEWTVMQGSQSTTVQVSDGGTAVASL